jgi:hypothetical protein
MAGFFHTGPPPRVSWEHRARTAEVQLTSLRAALLLLRDRLHRGELGTLDEVREDVDAILRMYREDR